MSTERRQVDTDRRHVQRGGRRLLDREGWRTLRMAIGAQVYAAIQASSWKPSIARSASLAGLSESGLANVLNDLDDVKLGTLFRFAEAHGLLVTVRLSPRSPTHRRPPRPGTTDSAPGR